jgi:hypothetical protein
MNPLSVIRAVGCQRLPSIRVQFAPDPQAAHDGRNGSASPYMQHFIASRRFWRAAASGWSTADGSSARAAAGPGADPPLPRLDEDLPIVGSHAPIRVVALIVAPERCLALS